MASPQTSNGYAPIANELLDALLRFGFNRTQVHVILWVVRKTFGWSRKWAEFTWYGVAKDLEMSRSGVTTEGTKLIEAKVLHIRNGLIGIQKDYEKWTKGPKRPFLGKAFSGLNVQEAEHPAPVSQPNVQPAELKAFSHLNKTVQPAERFSDELNQENKKTNTTSLREVGGGAMEPTSIRPPTPLQEVMNHYIAFKGQTLTKEQTKAFYDRFGKAAKSLLEACAGDPNKAKEAVTQIGTHLNDKGLSWSLETIYRWTCDPSLMAENGGANGKQRSNRAGEAKPIPGKYSHLGRWIEL